MYVVEEYLACLAVIAFFAMVLFGAAVLGLVVKTGASLLADQAAAKIPQIASRISPREIPDFKKDHSNQHAPA
jgi:hypothetical protein